MLFVVLAITFISQIYLVDGQLLEVDSVSSPEDSESQHRLSSGLTTYECQGWTDIPTTIYLTSPNNPIGIYYQLDMNFILFCSEIVSANYPLNSESSHLKCNFIIKALYGARITLTPVDVTLDGGCFDNKLTIFDDSSYPHNTTLQYPGVSASCGQSSIPPSIHPITTSSDVSLQFLRTSNSGQYGQIVL